MLVGPLQRVRDAPRVLGKQPQSVCELAKRAPSEEMTVNPSL